MKMILNFLECAVLGKMVPININIKTILVFEFLVVGGRHFLLSQNVVFNIKLKTVKKRKYSSREIIIDFNNSNLVCK